MILKFNLLAFFCVYILFSQNDSFNNSFQKEVEFQSKNLKEDALFNKTLTFFLKKEWDSTLIYSLKGLSKKKKNDLFINYFHLFRGYSFKEKQLFKQAIKEFKIISKHFVFYKNTNAFLGDIHLSSGEFKKALSYYSTFKKIDTNKLRGIEKSNLLHNFGLCYLHLKKFKESERYLKKSLSLYLIKKDTIQLIGAFGDIATMYYDQYKDDLAIPYFKKAYHLSQYVNSFKLKQNTAKNMAIVEENRKGLTAALKYRKEYEQWKDSLSNQNKIWETAQLEKKFVVAQKQNEVNVLKAENRAKTAERNNILYAAITLLLLLSIITYFFRKNIKSKKIIVNQNERLDTLNATKNKLFSIVSHDLRSSVNTLKLSNKKLINNLEAENIPQVHQLLQQNSAIVGSAYNLLDNLLNWALLQTKQSYFEIKEMHLFFAIEQVVYNYIPLLKEKQVLFENTVSKLDKVLADQESLKIILRNLLDNAIKFSKENDQIKIYTKSTKNNFLEIVIEDSGIGMDKETIEKIQSVSISIDKRKNKEIIGSGLGLQLCKSMIKKNKGILSIESELGKGTKMIVSLLEPLSNE